MIHTPRYAVFTCSSFNSAWPVPCMTTLPLSSTYARSAMARVCFTFCSTIRTVVPCSRILLMILKISRTRIGRESQRGLVEHQQLRQRHEAPADRDHLLLAAGQQAGRLASAFPEPGKEAEYHAPWSAPASVFASPRRDPMSRFSSTVMSMKSRRASGQWAMPRSIKRVGCDGMDRVCLRTGPSRSGGG